MKVVQFGQCTLCSKSLWSISAIFAFFERKFRVFLYLNPLHLNIWVLSKTNIWHYFYPKYGHPDGHYGQVVDHIIQGVHHHTDRLPDLVYSGDCDWDRELNNLGHISLSGCLSLKKKVSCPELQMQKLWQFKVENTKSHVSYCPHYIYTYRCRYSPIIAK